ncbi:putative phosphohydrolases, Icc family [Olavius algarvensis Delta 1 endosymbiont]|nr:putative phosphohydrolases, Icc family [Olavius algarvensis Delta 1 endosymbiont]
MVSANTAKSRAAGDKPRVDGPITLAHLSDPHISCMEDIALRDLISKRLFGYLRWKLHRGAEHESRVLSALKSDLGRTQPDHIAVTGDLTHLALPAEFKKARQWLQSLGSPSRVTVIPGNHDAYVKSIWRQTMARWTDYMISDSSPDNDPESDKSQKIFPSLRIRGCIALIGLSTARPSAPHLAVGTMGAAQLKSLEDILARSAGRQLYRILLIHHPPASGTVSWRKRLTDAADLRSLLDQYGAELILHGHAHRTLQNRLPSPTGNIPVMGAPSISALGRTPERRARYYIYRIKPGRDDWEVSLEVRMYSIKEDRFLKESGPGNVE